MKQEIINELITNEIIKYGSFTLKSGKKSNYYIDMKLLVSFPRLSNKLINYMYETTELSKGIDLVCGIPMGGIYFSTLFSQKSNLPMILLRNSVKNHGTTKLIEGNYTKNQNVVIIEDVITTGMSVIESIDILHEHGLYVTDIITLVNRNDEGLENIRKHMMEKHMCSPNIKYFVKATEIGEYKPLCPSPFTDKLNEIITNKGNICLSLDVPNWTKFFDILDKVKDKICLLKIHLDIMEYFGIEVINKLTKLAFDSKFMIWEDRKLCDIGNTNMLTINKLLNYKYDMTYNDEEWNEELVDKSMIDFISIYPIGGLKSIECLFDKIGIFLLSEMSSENNMIRQCNTNDILELANDNNTKVSGIINQKINRENIHENILSLTPGINPQSETDDNGQKYRGTSLPHNPDILVVGRYIYLANDPLEKINNI